MIEFTAFLLWNMWKNKNDQFFNKSKITEMEIIEKSQTEWVEYVTMEEESKLNQTDWLGQRVVVDSNEDHRRKLDAGCVIKCIRAAFQLTQRKARFEILAQNSQGLIQHAWAEARETVRNSVALFWEVVRSALQNGIAS